MEFDFGERGGAIDLPKITCALLFRVTVSQDAEERRGDLVAAVVTCEKIGNAEEKDMSSARGAEMIRPRG